MPNFMWGFTLGLIWRVVTTRYDVPDVAATLLSSPSAAQCEFYLKYYARQWYKKFKKS